MYGGSVSMCRWCKCFYLFVQYSNTYSKKIFITTYSKYKIKKFFLPQTRLTPTGDENLLHLTGL